MDDARKRLDQIIAVNAQMNAAQSRSAAAMNDLVAALHGGESDERIEHLRQVAVASYEQFLDAAVAQRRLESN